MALGSGTKSLKFVYFASTVIYWSLGCAIIGFGIWVCVHYKLMGDGQAYHCTVLAIGNNEEEISVLHSQGYIFIAAGLLLAVVAFFGFYSALKERCILNGFSSGVFLVVFLMLLGVGTWAMSGEWSGHHGMGQSTIETLYVAIMLFNRSIPIKHFMIHIQSLCQCCGADKGIEDYPKELREAEGDDNICKPLYYHLPCEQKLYFHDNLRIIISLAFGAATVLLISIALSAFLICSLQNKVSDPSSCHTYQRELTRDISL